MRHFGVAKRFVWYRRLLASPGKALSCPLFAQIFALYRRSRASVLSLLVLHPLLHSSQSSPTPQSTINKQPCWRGQNRPGDCVAATFSIVGFVPFKTKQILFKKSMMATTTGDDDSRRRALAQRHDENNNCDGRWVLVQRLDNNNNGSGA